MDGNSSFSLITSKHLTLHTITIYVYGREVMIPESMKYQRSIVLMVYTHTHCTWFNGE